MALFKFKNVILAGNPIDVHIYGKMCRFSNYVDDLVRDIHLLVEAVDEPLSSLEQIAGWDSLSPVDPFRIVNIGNASKVRHLDYLGAIKEIFVKKEFRNFINMQKSDEPET